MHLCDMTRCCTGLWLGLFLLSAGCTHTRGRIGDTEEPTRPAEYERLEMLVGTWEGNSHATFEDSDQVLTVRSFVQADWDLGRRYVVARSNFSFTDAVSGARLRPSKSVTWFTWDENGGKYRYWTFSSDGGVTSGSMEFAPSTNRWTLKQIGEDPATDEYVITGWGEMKYVSDSEKIVTWHSRPPTGGGFDSEGRSRKTRTR